MESFSQFSVSRAYEELRAQVVSGVVGGREVRVRFLDGSGEFLLQGDGGDRSLERPELKHLAAALRRFHDELPWASGATDALIARLDEALAPSALAGFELRSVTRVGHCILLAGRASAGDVDVIYDEARRQLLLMEVRAERATRKRPPTRTEREDLQAVLEYWLSRNLTAQTAALLRELLAVTASH